MILPDEIDPPLRVDEELGIKFRVRRCMRSGQCCKTATCAVGVAYGAEPTGCHFLRNDRPGQFSCGLVDDDPGMGNVIGVGAGCCMPMGNSVRNALVLDAYRQRSIEV